MLLLSSMGSWITLKGPFELKRRRRKRKSRKEKRRKKSHHHADDDSFDDSADLRHKGRSRKAYSDFDSDVSTSDDSRVVGARSGLRRTAGNIAMKRISFYSG
ncbi:UNVERIFIED_CONTAM: hypothetical protein Sindi_0374700 [Sesamum indicum]